LSVLTTPVVLPGIIITSINPGSVFGFFDVSLMMPTQGGVSASISVRGVPESQATAISNAMLAGTTLTVTLT